VRSDPKDVAKIATKLPRRCLSLCLSLQKSRGAFKEISSRSEKTTSVAEETNVAPNSVCRHCRFDFYRATARNLNVSDAQRKVRCMEEQMDCARFVEENGTLENQMEVPRPHSLSLSSSSFFLFCLGKERQEDARRDEERLSCNPISDHGIHRTVIRPVYTGQKSLDSRLPTVRRRSSKVRDKKISRASAPLTFTADICIRNGFALSRTRLVN